MKHLVILLILLTGAISATAQSKDDDLFKNNNKKVEVSKENKQSKKYITNRHTDNEKAINQSTEETIQAGVSELGKESSEVSAEKQTSTAGSVVSATTGVQASQSNAEIQETDNALFNEHVSAAKETSSRSNTSEKTSAPSDSQNYPASNTSGSNSVFSGESRVRAEIFSSYGARYNAGFKDAGKGAYFIDAIVYWKNWGFTYRIGTNAGIADKYWSQIFFSVGPAFGYPLDEHIMVGATFTYDCSYLSKQEHGNYKHDSHFGWGLSFEPRITFKAKWFIPYLGFMINWSKDSKEVDTGFAVGVEFSI